MATTVKSLEVDCQSPMCQHSTVGFQANLAMFIGVIQALQFALSKKEELKKEVECENCMHAIEVALENYSNMVNDVLNHELMAHAGPKKES